MSNFLAGVIVRQRSLPKEHQARRAANPAVDGEDLNGVVSSGFYEDALDRPTKLITAANVTGLSRQTIFSYDDTNRVITTAR